MRKQLVAIHWIHAVFLCLLLVTGLLLYLSGIPLLPKKLLRNVHLFIAFGYTGFLLYSLIPVGIYVKRLKKAELKKAHIYFIYFFGFLWIFSGVMLWFNKPLLLDQRFTALLLHDTISVLILPWVILHICWKTIKSKVTTSSTIRTVGKIVSRRQFLQITTGAIVFFSAGAIYKWFKPLLSLEETAFKTPVKKGYFRIFKVTNDIPVFDEVSWKLSIDGLVDVPKTYNLSDIQQMSGRKVTCDFHCVTGWSVMNADWEGIPFHQLVEAVKPKSEAVYIKMYSSDKVYTETFKLDQLMNKDVLLAFRLDGKPLSASQGAPCRLVHPSMYGYKSIKWVERIEFVSVRDNGYWEALERYDLDGYIDSL